MLQGIIKKIKNAFRHKAIVLMYHRIASPESDVWELAVDERNFEQHLHFLKKRCNVVPLQYLADQINAGKLKKDCIAITFDDGYIDNFTAAKALLEKYNLPATFFITSGQIAADREFWWDELERIFLLTPQLPGYFEIDIAGSAVKFDLTPEVNLTAEIQLKHRSWKAASMSPPTLRAQLYYKVWELLKPLPILEQEAYLQLIRKWAGLTVTMRADYKVMSESELKLFSVNNLFTIGAHTVNHPALAYHDQEFQRAEIAENKKYLEELTGSLVSFLAYPYGNYNGYTLQTAVETGFKAAFTTQKGTCEPNSHPFALGRLQVVNCTVKEFSRLLKV